MTYTINKLAKLAKVSVRTLHWYDKVGLLKPAEIGENGYRHYSEKELLRLQQILFYRELEFSLEEIKKVLDDPGFDLLKSLDRQKGLLESEKERLSRVITTINKTIMKVKGEQEMTDDELYEGLDKEKMKEYKEEAEQRWGKDTVARSHQIVKSWGKEKFQDIGRQGGEITKRLAESFKAGKNPESAEVQAIIEQHFHHIIQFYDPSWPLLKIYRGLGDMYVADPRFRANYDKYQSGLADYMQKAMNIYCDKQELGK